MKRVLTIIPPSLKPGDTIGVVCPAGYMAASKAQVCLETLQDWGFKVKVGQTLGSASLNYFSGTDEERLADFQYMLDDPEVKAILCARGGYGMTRIIDQINFKYFRKNPKWIIGFSDITVLLAHIYSRYKIAGLHAPMAAAFNDHGNRTEYVLSLRDALLGKKARYFSVPHELNQTGEGVGELVGGNLALLVHLLGTKSELPLKGRILFLEDVGEQLYSIDRMMFQLKRAGKFKKLAGLIIGGFTDLKDTERPHGKTVYEIISEIVGEVDYPVCYGFPVSHDTENYALKTGVGYKLKVTANKVKLEE